MVSGVNTLKVDLVAKWEVTYQWSMSRVSFAKKSDWDHSYHLQREMYSRTQMHDLSNISQNIITESICHASLQFRIKAPIFVARQLVKHQVGLVWNEISRRYVDPNQSSMFRKSGEKDHQTVSNKGQMSRIRLHMVSRYDDVCERNISKSIE